MPDSNGPGAPAALAALDRRDFLRRGSIASMAVMVGGVELHAAPRPRGRPTYSRSMGAERVACGIIGFGEWGREIGATLGRIENAQVAAVCDSFPLMLQRAAGSFPDAKLYEDYRQLLESDAITAVFVATPTHLHRDIVVAALDAGKHVYCEVPLAHTLEDTRAIADAAQAATGLIFQCGLRYRSNPQHRNVFQFIRSGAIGNAAAARAQWNRKNSWRRASATAARERELNWRLDDAVSTGILGEVGLHQIDVAGWIVRAAPVSVVGSGQVMQWRDGRRVADTVQAIFEFAGGLRFTYNATLVNSFDGEYDAFYGNDGTVVMRDSKAWLFKEVDAPLLGWEVYARKDRFYREEGVALVADATKLAAQGIDPAADDPNVETPLFYALEEFIDNNLNGPFPPAAGVVAGHNATVVALKANEAVVRDTRLEYDPAWFLPES
jgi:predicted dehydrogenase